MSNIIELSLTPDAVPSWTVWDALREKFQNFHDNRNGGKIDYEDGVVTILNYDTSLSRNLFVVGKSGKRRDPDSRGHWGDGSKTAIATLLREGKVIEIINDDLVWTPLVKYSDVFEEDVVCIKEDRVDEYSTNTDFIIRVSGITEEEWSICVENCLQLQQEYSKVTTSWGDVLLDEKHRGKIFAGGLFVANAGKFQYGYDILPKYVSLDRDRKRLNNFDLQWTTKDMVAQMTKLSESDEEIVSTVAESLYSGKQDTQYIRCGSYDNALADKCFDIYKEKHDGKILAETSDEVDKLKTSGYSNVTFLGNEGFTSLVKSSKGYKELIGSVEVKSPSDIMLEFETRWKDEMSIEMLDDFIAMQEKLLKLI